VTGPDIDRPDVDTLEAVAVAQAHGFEQNGRRIQAVRDLAARAREAERDAAAVREKMHHNAANLDVAIEQRMAAEADRDRYRIEADHGHDDYEDAEHVIRQIAEKRPNQTFDPWAAQLCAEFLERPSRTRSTIAEIRDEAVRLARRVAELEAALDNTRAYYVLRAESAERRVVELEGEKRDAERMVAAIVYSAGGSVNVAASTLRENLVLERTEDIEALITYRAALAGDGGGA